MTTANDQAQHQSEMPSDLPSPPVLPQKPGSALIDLWTQGAALLGVLERLRERREDVNAPDFPLHLDHALAMVEMTIADLTRCKHQLDNLAAEEDYRPRRDAVSAPSPEGCAFAADAEAFLQHRAEKRRAAGQSYDPWVVCFGVNLLAVADEGRLPDDAPGDCLPLCTWLERRLVEWLRTQVPAPFEQAEYGYDGETLSIRYVFWGLDPETMLTAEPELWEILEIELFSEIYDCAPPRRPKR